MRKEVLVLGIVLACIVLAGPAHADTASWTTSSQPGCRFSASPTGGSFDNGGGAGSIALTTDTACTWTVQSWAPWITITAGNQGSGNSVVYYTVAPNTGSSPRQGVLLLAGRGFGIAQGEETCAAATTEVLGPEPSTGQIRVALAESCPWTAVSSVPWITITAAPYGTGSATVTYSILGNKGEAERLGTITVAGQKHTFIQEGGLTYKLSLHEAGNGSGSVSANGKAYDSGAVVAFPADTSVMLIASPAAGSTFFGWTTGPCTGTGKCTVKMIQDFTVIATFLKIVPPSGPFPLAITKTGSGSGTVVGTPVGIDCGQTCSYLFAPNSSVTLTASAAAGSIFAGWSSGPCSGTGKCTVTMNQVTNLTATFNKR